MFTSDLDVVNDCLASLGEAPLNAVDDEHPYVAGALRMLKQINRREQAKGWWFNRDVVTLHPDPNTGFITIPSDTISVDPVSQWTHLIQRGRRLFNPRRGNGFVFTHAVTCNILRAIPFEDLPSLAQDYIGYCTVAKFQGSYEADRVKIAQTAEDKQSAFIDLRAEDIRNTGANLLYKRTTLNRANDLGLYAPAHTGLSANYGVASVNPGPPAPGSDFVDFAAIFNNGLEN